MTHENMLTLKDAATEYGVGMDRLRAWILYGKLSKVKHGKFVYVQRGELENMIYAKCAWCGKQFKQRNTLQKYCDNLCRQKAYEARRG